MVFHWSLSDSKSPQVSKTLLSILAVLNNAFIWMFSTRPLTFKSSSPFNNPLVTVPKAPIIIGIIVIIMFHSFFSSLARSRYLILLFPFFYLQVFHTSSVFFTEVRMTASPKSLQDASKYPTWIYHCCNLAVFNFSLYIQSIKSLFQLLGDCFTCPSYYYYYYYYIHWKFFNGI